MDANTLTTLISTLGFPIVCCGALFWYVNKQEKRHSDEIAELRKTIENNTLAVTTLVSKLGGDK